MRAIFIISSKPPPSLKEPEKWSPAMVDFVKKCLAKDCDKRSSADELLFHPWIRKAVKEIGHEGNGLEVLRELADEFSDEIERMRLNKFNRMMPDNMEVHDISNVLADQHLENEGTK
jgi:serine/threonine protein kinase